jgi:short-subunit dehydrogenase
LIEINLMGVVHGCHTFIEWLKKHPHRSHVINTASLAAYTAGPTMAAYNVAKSGVLALSETLYVEARQHGVGVTVLCPGFFRSNLLDCGHYASEEQRQFALKTMEQAVLTADDVADLAVRAMRRRRLHVVVGRRARGFWRAKRWFPRLYLSLLAARYAKGLPESM